jgi:murein hydrolase activator
LPLLQIMFQKRLTYFLFLTISLGLLTSQEGFAQRKSREQLEREKKRNLEKIEETKKVLSETKEKKQATVGQIKALKERISTQEEQIGLMEEDVQLIDVEMQDIFGASQELEKKLGNLRHEYAAMLYAASKSSGKINKLSFLFSASNFNQFFMRYKYLQQYTDNRKAQLYQIRKVTALLKEKESNLLSKKSSKERLLSKKVEEAENLTEMKQQRSVIVHELTAKERELRNQLESSKRSVNKLENIITRIVEREIARKNRERELRQDREAKLAKLAKNKKAKVIKEELDNAEAALGSSFAASKSKLPWPVKSGFISDRFGVKEHPVLNGVMINNNGVDIQTSQNATVRTVYDGEVRDISEIPGLGNVVAIQHGDYFTVYANLKTVFVLVGQKVSTKETIGTALETNGATEINFQIWHNTEKMNPENWLMPR